jgi:hypothetical protein
MTGIPSKWNIITHKASIVLKNPNISNLPLTFKRQASNDRLLLEIEMPL